MRALAAILTLGLCAMALVALPSRASAAPDPTLSLAELQTMLDASPSGVPGYFKTVVGGPLEADQTPVQIDMTVLGVLPNAGYDGLALILFQADMTDPVMARIGTIASGMSGSPLYVDDGGTWKVVGALSYGVEFTLGGLGLATPIDAMKAIMTEHPIKSSARTALTGRSEPSPTSLGTAALGTRDALTVTSLAAPLEIDGTTVSRVVVAHDATTAKALRPSPETAAFSPLATVQIGGLPRGSAAHAALVSALEAYGHNVVHGSASGLAGWRSDFTTPMVPGAACATMYTDGPFWAGGIGTATYVDGDVVLAYGHPMDWSGRSGLYFDNAWIDGIWGSSAAAFKLGSPGKVRGTMTQDRNAAVGARLDVTPTGVPVTSTVTVAIDGTRTVTQTNHLAPYAVQLPQLGPDLAAAAVSAAAYKAADAWAQPGSAETTTRVRVTDGTTTYTVTRDNLWYDSSDVSWTTAEDVWHILGTLLADPDGVAPARIVSVELVSRIVATPNTATIVGVSLPEGLKEGANRVVVRIRPYGSMTALDVPVTLTLPAGTFTQGWLAVSSGYEPVEGGESPVGGLSAASTPATLAQVVEELNDLPNNADIKVTFIPGTEDSDSITATAATDHVVRGSAGYPLSSILLQLRPAMVAYRAGTVLQGMVSGVSAATTVEVWSRAVGRSQWRLVDDQVPVELDPEMGGGRFTYPLAGFRTTTDLRVVWAGDGRTLGSSAETRLAVKARVSLRTRVGGRKVRLSATVMPTQAGARVRFEVRRRSGWKPLRTVRLSAKSTANWTWKAPAGTHKVRARFLGSTSNAAAATKVRTIVVP